MLNPKDFRERVSITQASITRISAENQHVYTSHETRDMGRITFLLPQIFEYMNDISVLTQFTNKRQERKEREKGKRKEKEKEETIG